MLLEDSMLSCRWILFEDSVLSHHWSGLDRFRDGTLVHAAGGRQSKRVAAQSLSAQWQPDMARFGGGAYAVLKAGMPRHIHITVRQV